jgi:hypothetical protein
MNLAKYLTSLGIFEVFGRNIKVSYILHAVPRGHAV